jgi:hypothetical protein
MDYQGLIPLIESAMDKTRRNPKPGEPVPSDSCYAWVILNEFRRAGFDIIPKD